MSRHHDDCLCEDCQLARRADRWNRMDRDEASMWWHHRLDCDQARADYIHDNYERGD